MQWAKQPHFFGPTPVPTTTVPATTPNLDPPVGILVGSPSEMLLFRSASEARAGHFGKGNSCWLIAWRIMLMTLLGRETPELPAEVLFSDIE